MSDDEYLPAHILPLPPTSQPATLLWTKLRIPPTRSGCVPRTRLLIQLKEGVQRKLTLVSAPAGFGKTTCLSAWATHPHYARWPIAWITLDASDNDPLRFWAYVIAAMDSLQAGFEPALAPWLPAVQSQPIEVFLAAFVNSLATITHDYILILDDYHLIDSQPIHAALGRLLEMMPPQMHLVIASRIDPPLSLARLRARDQLTSLRTADLRFSPEEAEAFLNRAMGLELPGEAIAALEARTEGWIAGLQLAALSLQGRDDVQAFVAAFSGSHRYVLDYLAEEVLQRQPAWLQTFLLRTSILDRLCASLCAAVSPTQDAGPQLGQRDPVAAPDQAAPPDTQAVLDYMERANLFLIPLDDERRWYRYHHLFADLLRHYLRAAHPGLIAELHGRASAWYADNQLLNEAVEHALAAPLYPRAAELIEQAAWPMLEQRGEVATPLRWLQLVPSAEIRARPRLCVMYAWLLLLSSQVQAAEQWLPDAEAAQDGASTADHDGDTAFILGYGAAGRAYLAILQNDLRRAGEHASQALTWLPESNRAPRGVLRLFQGGVYRLSGNVRAATEALMEASTICQAVGNRLVAVSALSNLAEVQIIQGQLHLAYQTFQQALRQATSQHGRLLPIAGRVYIGLGDLLRQWDDLAEATRVLDQSISLLQAMAATEELMIAYACLARVKQAQGQPDAACLLIDQAEQLARDHHLPDKIRWARTHRIWLALAQGRPAAGIQWANEQQPAPSAQAPPVFSSLDEFEALTRARVLIAQSRDADNGALQEALALLAQLEHAAEEAGRYGTLIGILVLQALAFQAQGELQAAHRALERALELAEAEGYIRIFIDEGAPMIALLSTYRRSHPESASVGQYVERLLQACGEGSLAPDPHSVDPPTPRASPLVEPLSERELEILRLLAAGRSNQEIGQALMIAEGTVKKHIHNICGKLEVRGRTQAVLQATALGLV